MSVNLSLPEAWQQHDKKVKPYQRKHKVLSVSRSAVSLLFMLYLFLTGAGQRLESEVFRWVELPFIRWLLFFGWIGLLWEIMSLPFSWASYQVERSAGQSKQGFGSWAWDHVKGLMVGSVLGSMVLGLLFIAVTNGGDHWWWIAATLFFLFSVGLAQVMPILLIPIFFKMKPMEENDLKRRLLALCDRFKVVVKDVYHLGLGEKTEKGNAAFVGLGRTKRILIGDTLYEKYLPEQVEAVFAHELGHQVNNDIWKGIFLSTAFVYLGFFIANLICENYALRWSNTDLSNPLGLLVFFVVLTLIQLPMGVVQAIHSRWRENEADRFAIEIPGQGKHLGDALERLTVQNLGLFRPNRFWEFLTYSHPAPWRRILRTRAQS